MSSPPRNDAPAPDRKPITTVNGRVLVAVAARVGPVRLIDNTLIEEVATS